MTAPPLHRRDFLRHALLGTATLSAARLARADVDTDNTFPPTRVITHGPRHHWFGYYDKLQFDPTGRFVLGMEVDFEHRSPTADDVIKIGMVDLQEDDRWIELGQTTAWNWQQGCMLQWIPGSSTEILWNDRQDGHYVCRILDVQTKQTRVIDHPIYTISPDGKSAVAPDFRRINDMRPGYGYTGLPDPHADNLAPTDSGILHIDLATGQSRQILSLADIAHTGTIPNNHPAAKHYFNHLLFNPDGTRFIALHRWRVPTGGWLTRMITAAADGTDARVIIDNGHASHFIWRDPDHILVQTKNLPSDPSWGNYLIEDKPGGTITQIGRGILDPGGHLSYLPDKTWILCDTYPRGKSRIQTPHLYHIPTSQRIDLGAFPLPPLYKGEWRVDTHPRLSPTANQVCIDAPTATTGRQLHLIDIGEYV